jgi:hypothetical protein
MKNLIIMASMALIAFPAFAQIDDVINKPKVKKVNTQPSMFVNLIKLFNSVEMTNLVETLRKDGVQESKYYAVIGVSGQIVKISMDYGESEVNRGRVLPFTIKVSSDEKVQLITSLFGIGNMFEDTVGTDSLVPVKKADFAVFNLDRGMSFSDIKTMGWRAFDVDLAVPIIGYSKTRYISFDVGGEIGGEREEIKLDNGETLIIGPGKGLGTVNGDYECTTSNCWTGSIFVIRAGLELREEVGKRGYVQINAKAEYRTVSGGNEAVKNDYIHSSLYLKPSISYTTPISKNGKTKLTFGVSADIGMMNKVETFQGGYTEYNAKTPNSTIDLGNRNRQPYQAKLIITF